MDPQHRLRSVLLDNIAEEGMGRLALLVLALFAEMERTFTAFTAFTAERTAHACVVAKPPLARWPAHRPPRWQDRVRAVAPRRGPQPWPDRHQDRNREDVPAPLPDDVDH
ncbi:MAG: hypothetical protein M3460_25345 [Actinomycetota bacterium]|nr:hypothetical protein [Actinomycetota bacterium]